MRQIEIIKNVLCSGEEEVMCPRSMSMQDTGDVDWVGCHIKCAWFDIRPLDPLHEHPESNCKYAYCKDHCIGVIKEDSDG